MPNSGQGGFVPAAPLDCAAVDDAKLRERVQHVVVLMLENRSFDHMLGFLDHPFPDDFDQANLAQCVNSDGAAKHAAAPGGQPNRVDPDHSHLGILEQMGAFDGVANMGGFIKDYDGHDHGNGPKIMECLTPETTCPVLAGLAKEFAVCTRWFSSVPGETWPNRNFAHAATSDRSVNIEIGFYVDTTIFERLEQAKAKWHIYYDGPPEVWFFRRLWQPRWRDFLPKSSPRLANWFGMPHFYEHVAAGTLPEYSFIEPAHNHYFEHHDQPRQTNSQHCHNNMHDPTAADFVAGEALIAAVYDALVANQALFEKTLLVITYDEHGGLYDHVPPPPAVDPEDPKNVGITRRIGRFVRKIADWKHHAPKDEHVTFDRLGVRVPAVLVSPWIHPGRIVTNQLEHASIPATLRARFAPRARPLTKRDKNASTFACVAADSQSLDVARRVPGAPSPVPPLKTSADFRPPGAAPISVADRLEAAAAVPAPAPESTAFDDRLKRAGDRMAADLTRSSQRGVLRRARSRAVVARREPVVAGGPEAEPEVLIRAGIEGGPPLTAVPAGFALSSVEPGSPLEVFHNSTHTARGEA